MSINWDDFYKKFEERFRESESSVKKRLSFYLPLLKVYAQFFKPPLALDLGCGRGEFLEILRDLSFQAQGLDLNPLFVKHCQRKGLAVREGEALSFMKESPSQSLHLISAFHLLEHLPFQVQVELIFHIYRALQPGGVALFETPNPENFFVGAKNFWLDPTHLKPLPPELLSFICEYVGFSEVHLFYLQGLKKEEPLSLKEVFQGASQDYALLAIKETSYLELKLALSQALELLTFQQSSGTAKLLESFDKNLEDKINTLEQDQREVKSRWASIFEEFKVTKSKVEALWNSKPWRFYQVLGRLKRRLLSFLRPEAKTRESLSSWQEAVQAKDLTEREELLFGRLKRLWTSGNLPLASGTKPTLAYVSPLPPLKTGIASYSEELLSELSTYYEITLVSDQEEVESSLKKTFPVLSPKEFLDKAFSFERILYHLGNSPFHGYQISLLREVPGVVVLHEVFLSDLMLFAERSGSYPWAFVSALYEEGGYGALLKLKQSSPEAFLKDFPLASLVVNFSLGAILHSEHALSLLKKFYPQIDLFRLRIVPHLRKLPSPKNLLSKEASFVVSTFGFITPLKQVETLLQAFSYSRLSKAEGVRLYLVGEVPFPEYEKLLRKRVEELGLAERVVLTGYVERETYESYLWHSDLVVQLRGDSRGETSGALLDALAFGKPVLVNAHGFFAELPEGVVYKIRENFSVEELAWALEELYENQALRESLGLKAKAYVAEAHNPSKVAKLYFEALESLYERSEEVKVYRKLLERKTLREGADLGEEELKDLAKSLAQREYPLLRKRRLWVDLSALVREDLQTGIQRVVKAQLKYLLREEASEFLVEPVYMEKRGEVWELCYARSFTASFLGLDSFLLPEALRVDRLLRGEPGALYYVPDLFGGGVCEAYRLGGFYEDLKRRGVKIVFLVHDLLPIKFPQYFPEGADEVHACYVEAVLRFSDLVLTNSQATAEDLLSFAKERGLLREELKVKVLPLGADFSKVPHKEPSPEEEAFLSKLHSQKFFLMVGTLEPRKGHALVLSALERLWEEGREVALVIVGKEGWMVEDLMKRIKGHPELGKRLFYLGQVSDALLEILYRKALAVICASQAEGFGLPLVEALYSGAKVIARDIPVFRELETEGVYFFENREDPLRFSEFLREWLGEEKRKEPSVKPPLTWEKQVFLLKDILQKIFFKNP